MVGEPDRTADRTEHEAPLRTCVVTRRQRPVDELMRFVPGPDGVIVPDLARRLPGRGIWVTCNRHTVAKAAATNAFARSLRRAVTAPPDLAATVAQQLTRRICNALSLCNKSGLVITGFARIDAAIAAGEPVALVHGADAGADGVDKLDRRFRAMCRDGGREARVINSLTIDQLSLALGRPNVVHAALKSGGAAELFLAEAATSSRYLAEDAGDVHCENRDAARRDRI